MTNFHHSQPLTTEQEQMLIDVKSRILAEAKTFDMSLYIHTGFDCNTPSCIAGHLVFANVQRDNFNKMDYFEVEHTANNLLGSQSKTRLFNILTWDIDLQTQYLEALDYQWDNSIVIENPHIILSQIACRAIDRYISNTHTHFANESKA